MSPAVSVIIPTYNRWPMVGEAIESVLAQSYRDFELIVVDDGSTDGTAKELEKFGSCVRLVVQPRRGVSAARNKGLSIANSPHVAFLDSDDLWLPEKLKIQTAFMAEHPQCQICQTEETWVRRGVRVNPMAKHRKPCGDIFRLSLELCLVSPSAVMMTKDLFDHMGGFDESFPVCEDYDLWLRVAVDHSVPLIPAALVIKRGGHRDQLSRSTWGMDRYRVASLQKLLRAGVGGEKRDWAIDTLKRKVFVLSQGARKRGKEEEALAYDAIPREFNQEPLDATGADSRVCESERIPSADARAVVGLG